MIEETGQVVDVDGDSVRVRAASRAGCQRCAEGRGCGGGVIGLLLADRLSTVIARRGGVHVAVGDRVAVAIPAAILVRAAASIYLLPLALMLAAMLLADALWPRDAIPVVIAAASGLGIGLMLAGRISRRGGAGLWRPRVVRRLATDRACG